MNQIEPSVLALREMTNLHVPQMPDSGGFVVLVDIWLWSAAFKCLALPAVLARRLIRDSILEGESPV